MSWLQTLHFAFAERWQFGQNLIFTFGPWGFLCGGYYPPTFLISALTWVTLAFVFWLSLWKLSRHFWKSELWAWVWMMGCIGIAGLPLDQNFDVRLDAWILLLFFLHFFTDESAFSPVKILLVASLGLLGLTKFTGLMMASGMVMLVAVDDLWQRRRFPWLIVVFGGSTFFFWAAAGQKISSFWPYLVNSWRITSGYTEAMSSGGGAEHLVAVIYWLAASASGFIVGLAAFAKPRRFGAGPLLGLGLVLFLAFKHGFVRHDQHESESVLVILLTGFMGWAAAWPVLRGGSDRVKLLVGLPSIIILTYASVAFSLCVPGTGLLPRLLGTLAPRAVLSPAKLMCNASDLKNTYEKRRAEVRESYPLPELKGSVDVYPWDQAVVFANSWWYVPRPVFQSYSAYTPELAELNAAYLRRRCAADNLLLAVKTVDGRFPSLDDGYSWPELLTRYTVQNTTKDFVLLKKSATPKAYHLELLQDAPLHFGEPISLLSIASNGPIWVELEINQTPLGALASAFYKPPALTLAISLRGGRQLGFRLIPGMARSGFLLSPLINDNLSFATLASGDQKNSLAKAEVVSMNISAATPSGTTKCYHSRMQLRCYRLAIASVENNKSP